MRRYFQEPFLDRRQAGLARRRPDSLLNRDILRPASDPFEARGRPAAGHRATSAAAVIKISAVKPENRVVEAAGAVFDDPG